MLVDFFLSVPVITMQTSLSNPKFNKLISNPLPLGDDHIQTLVFNNSQETKTLKGHLQALKSQVLLMFICNILLNFLLFYVP